MWVSILSKHHSTYEWFISRPETSNTLLSPFLSSTIASRTTPSFDFKRKTYNRWCYAQWPKHYLTYCRYAAIGKCFNNFVTVLSFIVGQLRCIFSVEWILFPFKNSSHRHSFCSRKKIRKLNHSFYLWGKPNALTFFPKVFYKLFYNFKKLKKFTMFTSLFSSSFVSFRPSFHLSDVAARKWRAVGHLENKMKIQN